MCIIYNNIQELCRERGIKPGRMCTDIKISKSILAEWSTIRCKFEPDSSCRFDFYPSQKTRLAVTVGVSFICLCVLFFVHSLQHANLRRDPLR